MATLSVTIPNAQVTRINNAFGAAYGYQATINGSPNPESLTQFATRKVREFIKDVVKGQEAVAAAEAARVAALAAAESEITLT